jgi:hypothetical protein
MSGEPMEQWSTAPNGRLRRQMNSEQCASQKLELRCQNALDCPVPQEDKGTISSLAMTIFRVHYYDEQARIYIPSVNTDSFIRAGYYGGHADVCIYTLWQEFALRSTALNPNCLLTWHTPDNEQCHVRCTTVLSGVPSTATARIVVGAINSPQPPPFKPSKFLDLNIQYKSKSLHSKTQSKDQILSMPQNQLNCLVTSDRVFSVSFVALVAWIAFSFSL